jgi:short-subunit dehydrogenase
MYRKRQKWLTVRPLPAEATRRSEIFSFPDIRGTLAVDFPVNALSLRPRGKIRYNGVVNASNISLAGKTVLITGASSGIGLELAHLFANDGYRLVLVARNRAALHQLGDELQSTHSIEVRISPKDLAHPSAPSELYQELQEAGIVLDVLVNNAGFGGSGPFLQTDWYNEAEMIQVNIVAVAHLTKLFLPQIRARSGKILNVGSVAAFLPGPYTAVYYASKAFVLHFTEALAEELSGSAMTVTCLCPGPVQTNFQQRAHTGGASRANQRLALDVREVARSGYEGMKHGRRLVIPGWKNRLLTEMLRLTPRSTVTRMVGRMYESRKSGK